MFWSTSRIARRSAFLVCVVTFTRAWIWEQRQRARTVWHWSALERAVHKGKCLETIEELDGENREIFEEYGGKKFSYIPCLNDQPDHINLIGALIKNELQGWV